MKSLATNLASHCFSSSLSLILNNHVFFMPFLFSIKLTRIYDSSFVVQKRLPYILIVVYEILQFCDHLCCFMLYNCTIFIWLPMSKWMSHLKRVIIFSVVIFWKTCLDNYISEDPSGMSSHVLYVTVTDVSKESGWFTFLARECFSDFLASIMQ